MLQKKINIYPTISKLKKLSSLTEVCFVIFACIELSYSNAISIAIRKALYCQ